MIFSSGINAFASERNAQNQVFTAGGTKSTLPDNSIDVGSRFFELIFGKKEEDKNERNDIYLCPGGDAFGVKISGIGVTVSKITNGAPNCLLQIDDKILSIEGRKISSISEVKDIINYLNY